MSKLRPPSPTPDHEESPDYQFAVRTLRELAESGNEMVQVRAAEALARLVRKQAPTPEDRGGEMTEGEMRSVFVELARELHHTGMTRQQLVDLLHQAASRQ